MTNKRAIYIIIYIVIILYIHLSSHIIPHHFSVVIFRFPMGVPPVIIHFGRTFHEINHPASLGYPIYGNPPYGAEVRQPSANPSRPQKPHFSPGEFPSSWSSFWPQGRMSFSQNTGIVNRTMWMSFWSVFLFFCFFTHGEPSTITMLVPWSSMVIHGRDLDEAMGHGIRVLRFL